MHLCESSCIYLASPPCPVRIPQHSVPETCQLPTSNVLVSVLDRMPALSTCTTHPHAPRCEHTRTHTHAHVYTHSFIQTLTHTHTNTNTLTHTHTHTHKTAPPTHTHSPAHTPAPFFKVLTSCRSQHKQPGPEPSSIPLGQSSLCHHRNNTCTTTRGEQRHARCGRHHLFTFLADRETLAQDSCTRRKKWGPMRNALCPLRPVETDRILCTLGITATPIVTVDHVTGGQGDTSLARPCEPSVYTASSKPAFEDMKQAARFCWSFSPVLL
jgi:hypothetical protein